MKDKQSKDTRQSKDSDWFRVLFGPLVVGVMMLTGQAYVQPWVAEGVKRKESILEQKYNACESAVNILQRRLASVEITGTPVPEWYEPPEKNPPTQLEMNTVYTLLKIYCKSPTIAEEFFTATGPGQTDPADIIKFVSAVRKELGVDKNGLTSNEFNYRMLRLTGEIRKKDE